MNKEFERIERVREILSKYKWFFDVNCNQYVLESYASDIRAGCASNYLDGLWWMFQESRKQINDQQKAFDKLHDSYEAVVDELVTYRSRFGGIK